MGFAVCNLAVGRTSVLQTQLRILSAHPSLSLKCGNAAVLGTTALPLVRHLTRESISDCHEMRCVRSI